MPTEAAAPVHTVRILRLAAGVTLSLVISQAVGWTLSYIAPLLTLVILGLPVTRPPARFFVGIVAAVIASTYAAFVFLPMLLHQRIAGLIVLAVALFHTFYLTARGKPAVLGTLLTVGITLTVAVGTVSVDALLMVAEGVAFGAVVGAAVAFLAHAWLPDPEPAVPQPEPVPVIAAAPVRLAMRSLCVVLPVTVWFLLSPSSVSNIPVMIKVAAMGQEASTAGSRHAARSLIVSTAAGGVAAIVAWQVLAIWPSLLLYALIMAIACLGFGARIFSGEGLATGGDTWSYALLTMIVILAPAALDSQFGSAAAASFYTRLFMLLGASAYGVAAVYLFDHLFPAPGDSRSPALPQH